MGTWGNNNFENDDARDWFNDFCTNPSYDKLSEPINRVLDNKDYLEAPDCSTALAASEIIAALNSKPNSQLPDEVNNCLQKMSLKHTKELSISSRAAIQKILKNSELKELWDDSPDQQKWLKNQKNLLSRL